eukprot:6193616-Pleurochrysis_carterae.AAC.2
MHQTGRTGPVEGAARSHVPSGGGSIGSYHPAGPGPQGKHALGEAEGTLASEASGWSGRVRRVGPGSFSDWHPTQSPQRGKKNRKPNREGVREVERRKD